MASIRRRDTKPEMDLRKKLWALGLRGYRLDVNLPGRPDIYYPKTRLCIFVDGCFWHKCPKHFRAPHSNQEYWIPKIQGNIIRDSAADTELREKGFSVARYWEHEVRNDVDAVAADIARLLCERAKQ